MNINLSWYFGIESSIKYFSLGAVMSAFSWLGVSLIYGITDSTNFMWLAYFISTFSYTNHSILNLGALLLIFLSNSFHAKNAGPKGIAQNSLPKDRDE